MSIASSNFRSYCEGQPDSYRGLPRKAADVPSESVALVFADPPFNIGFDYDGEYDDKLSPEAYTTFSRNGCGGPPILAPNGTFWLAIGDEWAAEL